jgi:hypothetical protein
MSDDIVARLRAERDEQKRRADYLSKDFDRDIKMYQAEVAELRAELAAANAERFNYKHHAEQRLIALREAESELRGEEETVAKLRVDLAFWKLQAEDAEQRLRVQEKWIGRAELAEAKIEIERQRARVNKWVNAAMRNEEYDDDGR